MLKNCDTVGVYIDFRLQEFWMDIQTTFNNQILQTFKSLVESSLNLAVGQQIAASVTATQGTTMTLRWGGQVLTLDNQNPQAVFSAHVGDSVTLQVTKTSPDFEFKVLSSDSSNQNYSQLINNQKIADARLKLLIAPITTTSEENLQRLIQTQRSFEAKVVSVVGSKIQLQLSNVQSNTQAHADNKMVVTIDKSQLQLLSTQANALQGQVMTLAMTKVGGVLQFKQLPSVLPFSSAQQQEKINSFIKQLLPKHESSNVLFTQLREDLPHLEITPTLKAQLRSLFDNLPTTEQLFNAQKLRYLVTNSGVFFEAKTAASLLKTSAQPLSTPTQTSSSDLKMPLLQLLQHDGVSTTIKGLISTYLQQLLKKEMTPSDELTSAMQESEVALHAQLSQLVTNEKIPTTLKSLIATLLPQLKPNSQLAYMQSSIGNATPSETIEDEAAQRMSETDFKGDLLRLMHTLKQVITQKTTLALTDVQIEKLQQLHNKTENALAKMILDQLGSVPKDDVSKQAWTFELPFLMNNQVDMLKMEIQRDRISHRHAATGPNLHEHHWSVNLTLTPPQLGQMQCVIYYENGVVNTCFRNEQPQTTELISKSLDDLKQQFQRVGLTPGLMSAHDRLQTHKTPYSFSGTSLLDETV